MTSIENYHQELLKKIPIVKSLGINIKELSQNKVILSVPLEENINYEGTAFGGSLNTAAILSCYLMVHHLLKSQETDFSSLVIQKSSIEYLTPVASDFEAHAGLPDEKQVKLFLRTLNKRGRSRISIHSQIYNKTSEQPSVGFKGSFVATI